jgi:thioredoxin-dependent peroxiredoxin
MLKAGSEAPRFSARNQDGAEIRLADFLGRKNVVLYFFPKDGTPG